MHGLVIVEHNDHFVPAQFVLQEEGGWAGIFQATPTQLPVCLEFPLCVCLVMTPRYSRCSYCLLTLSAVIRDIPLGFLALFGDE